ncbi:DNA helicase [Trifolium repens]|nr:DNA helicase [Trifolium repens]
MDKPYDAVKDVTKKKELWRVGVVVDDIWITYKGGSEEHIELLLRDVKGDTIQATILRDDIAKWKDKLKGGKTYSMRNFRVTKNEGGFKMTPHNFMLTFVGTTTKVEEIVMPEIPATLFNFKDFAEILADVIGVVHTVGKCVSPTNTRKGSAAFILSDLSHHQIDCTLWDAMSVKFLDHINSRPDFGPVVLIMKHVRVKEPQGIYNIQLSNVWDGTKLLFDENIPEIKTFKDSLPKNVDYSTQQSAAISTSTQIYTQGSVGTQYNSDEYFMKDAQVVRLADMKKMNEDTLCVCVVTTSHVKLSSQGWYFMSCTECQTKAEGNEPPFVCKKGHKTTDPVIKYKLDVEVEDVDDEEETAKFVFWDSTLNDLLGITAKDLIKCMC